MPGIWPGPPLVTCQVNMEASCQSNGIGRGGRAVSDDSGSDAVRRRGVASWEQLEANRARMEHLRAELEALHSGLGTRGTHGSRRLRGVGRAGRRGPYAASLDQPGATLEMTDRPDNMPTHGRAAPGAGRCCPTARRPGVPAPPRDRPCLRRSRQWSPSTGSSLPLLMRHGTAPSSIQAVTTDRQEQRTGAPVPGSRGRLN